MPAPPPPPPPTFSAPAANADGRGMLLQSIRAGKSLKKTVTVDKSAPALSGKIKDDTTSTSGPLFRGNGGSIATPATNNGPPNLGGLFSGGMPKLKPTGLRSNIMEKDTNTTGNPCPPVAAVSPAPSVKRGPPPVPPPATQKPQIFPEAPEPIISKGFGKPALAPRPPAPPLGAPQKPSPPPKKLNLMSGPSVSRAQSMRLPRSPPVLAPASLSSLHQSQDCLNETQHSRPLNRVLRPPVARPPSPPTSKSSQQISHNVTRVAPPPPSRLSVTAPSMPPPPPPPPYRSTSMHQRLAPPPPPTPPTRIASAASSSVVRNGQSVAASTMTIASATATTTTMMMNLDLETRFADKFHSIMNFPNPSPFRGFPKVYNSKNAAKQQAPAPPLQPTSTPSTMLQLNASSGGKPWQHNAASSAC